MIRQLSRSIREYKMYAILAPPHDGWGGGHGSPDPHPHGGIYGQRRKDL